MNRVAYLTCLLIIFLYSCKTDINKPGDMGYDYFPNTAGRWVQYDVDSIYHDAGVNVHDTLHFQVLDSIESMFLDNSNRNTQRIERFYRNDSLSNWDIKQVWHGNVTLNTAEKVEENVRYIKLHFPIKQDDTWDGHLLNDSGKLEYRYMAVYTPCDSLGGFHFDSTVTVRHIDSTNFVNRLKDIEIYAKNIGMIYKIQKNYTLISGTLAPDFGWEKVYKVHAFH